MTIQKYTPNFVGGMQKSIEGGWVSYEDHLLEVAKLMHIISALEGQIAAESRELGEQQKYILGLEDSLKRWKAIVEE